MEGTIDKKVEDKGFGFIKGDDGQSYFFHFTDLEGEIEGFEALQEGETISFDIGEWRDGKEKATNVVVA